jgi:cell division control protein 6
MSEDMLLWEETLFRDRSLFELDYQPEFFLHRDSQMNSLKFCARPAVHGARPVNAICLGPPGTGKTTAVKKLFEEIEAHTKRLVPVYVNCQMDSTRFGVLYQVHKKLFGHGPPSSGVSFKRIFEKVMSYIASKEIVLMVALDDFNYLFHEREVDQVLYTLLRAHETTPGVKIGVIAILSEPSMKYVLDPRVTSVFQPEEILFPLYSGSEIRDILIKRIENGFYHGVISEQVVDLVVDLTERAGDLRVGLDLLRRSALSAESRASRSIELQDVEQSFERSRLVHLNYAIKTLKPDELSLLKAAAEEGTCNAGQLYSRFSSETGAGYTRFHEILNKLDSIRLIDTDWSGPGFKGRSRIVRVRYDPDEIRSRIK